MKVLWFEVTIPGRYKGDDAILGGWQDSLERIVRTVSDVDLTIAFEDQTHNIEKIIDGVRYIPIKLEYTRKEKKSAQTSWDINAKKLIPAMMKIITDIEPDIIHVFGTEWPFGLIARHTEIPVVVHIQGAIVPFNNALYPPRYSIVDVLRNVGWKHPRKIKETWDHYLYDMSRESVEREVWRNVENYMGRTEWDKGLSAVMHPDRKYFHVEEALRHVFTTGDYVWNGIEKKKIKLLSTGCISFRKGPEMMLKTAHILKTIGMDFEWNVAGILPWDIQQVVEKKERLSFDDCNIRFHGFVSGNKVLEMLCDTTLFIHTSYAENSPNSICEAQCIGVPVIATNVGGVSSLVSDSKDGILVPSNDPWMMAYQIQALVTDKARLVSYSENSRKKALERHNDENIKKQLMYCYNTIINGKASHKDNA